MAAEDFPLKGIRRIGYWCFISVFPSYLLPVCLYRVKYFPADQGGMRVADDDVILRAGRHLLMIHRFGLSLDQVAGIGPISQDHGHRAGLPFLTAGFVPLPLIPMFLLIDVGGDDARFVQAKDDLIKPHFLISPLENLAHHRGSSFVHDQFVAVLRVFHISIWRASPYKLTIQHGLMSLGFDLPADVQRVGFVDHVFQRQHNTAVKLVSAGGIKLVGDGNEPDIPGHEVLLDIIAGVDKIAAQAGQVFHDHAVNASCLDFFQHPLKTGPVIV